MESNNNQKNVFQRLAEVRKVADYVQKQDLRSEETIKKGEKGLGYKAVTSALVLLKVNQAINDHGLILTTAIKEKTVILDEYTNSYGKPARQFRADIITEMTWVNIDNPEDKIILPWGCAAVNPAPSQAIGAALTYAEKYFIQKFFNIPTDELDPDVIANNEAGHKDDLKNKVTNISDKKKVEINLPEKEKTIKWLSQSKDLKMLADRISQTIKNYPDIESIDWFIKACGDVEKNLPKPGNPIAEEALQSMGAGKN